MGKRSSFERIEKDKYDTVDPRAVPPLLFHLEGKTFVEPCAGKGFLMDQLTRHGLKCLGASDIEPDGFAIEQKDALTIETVPAQIITNPPWKRKWLHPLINHFITLDVDVWLLFDAAWAYTEQAAPFMPHCHKIVVVPRLNWFPGTEFDAQDDCAWYLFRSYHNPDGGPIFVNERGQKRC